MVKTEIKIQVTPEQSAKIQQICFDHGIYWNGTSLDVIHTDFKYLFIHNNYITCVIGSKSFFDEHEFKEIDPELFIATNGSYQGTIVRANGQSFVLSNDELTSIQSTRLPQWDYSGKSKIKISSIFEKYGFEKPDFECGLYDKLDDYILGAYFNPNKQKWTMCRWGFDGRNKQGSPNYALTPILVHKPWYETCKFPILVKADSFNTPVAVHCFKDKYVYDFRNNKYHVDSWTPLTDAEIEELKRGY